MSELLGYYKIDEGVGTALSDELGGSDATLSSSDVPAFWADAQVAQSIIDADNGAAKLCDASNHALPYDEAGLDVVFDGSDDQMFTKQCTGKNKEYLLYKNAQVDPALTEIKIAACMI